MTENEQHDIIDVQGEKALALPASMPAISGGSMLPPIEVMAPILAEYDKRKQWFIRWLEEHFTEGVHYGFPPGCKASTATEKEYKLRPTLYDAGARLLVDLFGFRLTYTTATDLAAASGEAAIKQGIYARTCTVSSSDGEVRGEGSGAFKVFEKKMNENSAIKMADKRARVAAVLDALPFIREMFTQDMEDMASPLDTLRQWTATIRKGLEVPGETSEGNALADDAWLARVAEQVLFGRTIVTTRRECKVIMDAIAAGQFDLRTGERVANPTPLDLDAPKQTAQGDGAQGEDAPAKSRKDRVLGYVWQTWMRLSKIQGSKVGEGEKKQFCEYLAGLIGAEVASPRDLTVTELEAAKADLDTNQDPRPKWERE